MKKLIPLLLAFVMMLTLCACGAKDSSTPAPAKDAPSEAVTVTQAIAETTTITAEPVEFPYIGTWVNTDGKIYLRVKDGGVILSESILTSSSTHTVNGVTTSSTSKSIVSNTYTWSITNGMFSFNGVKLYTPTFENEQYSLVSDTATFYRVGDLDYEIPLTSDEDSTKKDIQKDAEEYVLGTNIVVDGIEMVLEESGVTDNIRITSNSSGIKMTSGPSVEAGKQYVYLKGMLKNTGFSSTRAVIGGGVYLDGYEFNLRTDTIRTSGAPSSTIDPLETVHILLYAQITDEMAGMFSEGKIIFGFNDNFANVELEKAQHLYYVNVNR